MVLMFRDVSHYQGDYTPTGPTIAKATEGTGYVDVRYRTTRDRTLAHGWPFAGYHYLTPGNAAAQAAHAYSIIGNIPAMLDVERSTAGNATWADTKAFITAYRAVGGVLHLAYIPRWYWAGEWHSPDLTWLDDNDVALISSAYPNGGYTEGGVGWQAYGGVTPTIWQWTSTPLDTNAFRGTQDQLAAVFATGTTEGDHDMAIDQNDANTIWHAGVLNGGKSPSAYMDNLPDIRAKLDALAAAVDTITAPGVLDAVTLTDADVARIAAAVAVELSGRLAS